MQPTITEYLVRARQDDLRRATDARQPGGARPRRARLRHRLLRRLHHAVSLLTARGGRPVAPPPMACRASVPAPPSLPTVNSTPSAATGNSRRRPAA
jgi:hypothetical protein